MVYKQIYAFSGLCSFELKVDNASCLVDCVRLIAVRSMSICVYLRIGFPCVYCNTTAQYTGGSGRIDRALVSCVENHGFEPIVESNHGLIQLILVAF